MLKRADPSDLNILPVVHALGLVLHELVGGENRKDLSAIAARAADRRPGARSHSVAELIAEVEAFRAGLPVATYSNAISYRLVKFLGRNKLVLALVFMLVGLGMLVFVLLRE